MIAMAKPKPTPPAVLVIEDDQDVAMTINDVVEERGYRAICVPNGKAALSVLERGIHEAEADRRLFDSFGEVALVEREAQLAVLEDEVLSGVVVAAAGRVHGSSRPAGGTWFRGSSAS